MLQKPSSDPWVANIVVGLRLGRCRHLNIRPCCHFLGPTLFPTLFDRISKIPAGVHSFQISVCDRSMVPEAFWMISL